jgi:hypothetical protein
MRLALIASLLLVMAGRAAAQPGMVAPLPAVPSTASSPAAPAPPAPAPPPPPVEGDRDEGTADLLAVGGTLASWTTLLVAANTGHGNNSVAPYAAVSTLLAPSFGHWYAGTPVTGWLGLRAAAVLGLIVVLSHCEDECNVAPVAYGALALYAIGTIGDIATTGADVRRHNEERRTLRDLAVAPMIQRGGGGLVLGARF